MATYKSPDVYIEEISVFPPSVAEVETAVPAFIGYTEKAQLVTAGDLEFQPTRISSYKHFEQFFGNPDPENITVTLKAGERPAVDPPDPAHLLAYSVKMFFENGGGKCYIVSVGNHQKAVDFVDLDGGLAALAKEDEPTLIVIPDAVRLAAAKYGNLVKNVLGQCAELKDRFGIFDIPGADEELDATEIETARLQFGMNDLKYGAAYYPFLKTAMNHSVKPDWSNVRVVENGAEKPLGDFEGTVAFNEIQTELQNHYVVLPPSGAVAGIYAKVDTTRGVWKAPANMSLNAVIGPAFKIDRAAQDDLNVDVTAGKSINAIREFAGKGTLVWGARTLAGNDNEWRYVAVRRFFNMVEESVKKSTYWAVFESNDPNTWVKVRGMIENYLTQKWREGALAGATTKDAFFVRCGLGTTMNQQDILEGRMNVEIGMAVVRPAEFIFLRFSHKLQVS